jgi:hypothetical protein
VLRLTLILFVLGGTMFGFKKTGPPPAPRDVTLQVPGMY